MKLPRDMSGSELKRLMERVCFKQRHGKGDHVVLRRGDVAFTIAMKKALKPAYLKEAIYALVRCGVKEMEARRYIASRGKHPIPLPCPIPA